MILSREKSQERKVEARNLLVEHERGKWTSQLLCALNAVLRIFEFNSWSWGNSNIST